MTRPARGLVVALSVLVGCVASCSRGAPPPPEEVPTTWAEAGGPEAVPARIVEPEPEPEPEPAPEPKPEPAPEPEPAPDPAANVPAAPAPVDGVEQAEPPTLGPSDPMTLDRVIAFVDQPNPVPAWVDLAIGGASEPDADASVIRTALDRLGIERKRLDSKRDTIRDRHRAVLETGEDGRLPARSRLASSFKAHHTAVPALDAASVRLSVAAGFKSPLAEGRDLGPDMAGLALLLGAEGVDAALARRGPDALRWFRQQARFGAVVARGSRTLAELSAGVVAAQDALAMIDWLVRRGLAPESGLVLEDVRRARRELGAFGAALSRLGQQLRAAARVPWIAQLGETTRDPLWRYEAIRALSTAARVHAGKETAAAARAELLRLKDSSGRPEVSEVAAAILLRLDASGPPESP